MIANAKDCAVVLAGGLSRRMGFNKLTTPIAGHAMVWYPIKNLLAAGYSRIFVVVGNEREKVRAQVNTPVEWVVQEEQKGTGHALAQVIPRLSDQNNVVVLFGDCPFLDADIIQSTVAAHNRNHSDITLATANMKDARFLGRVQRGSDGLVQKVVNGSRIQRASGSNAEIFAGLSVWKAKSIRDLLTRLPKRRTESTFEYELPDAVSLCVKEGGRVSTFGDISEDDALGPNLPIEFEQAAAYLSVKVKARLISQGVAIENQQTVLIDHDVGVGPGTRISANSHLLGNTKVGSNCEIGPDATLKDCVVEDDCVITKGSWEGRRFLMGSRASDRLATNNRHFKQPHFLIPEEDKFCCVLLPFKPKYFRLFTTVIQPILKRAGFKCKIAGDRYASGIVADDIWTDINRARVVLAEITEPNVNVGYELGLAHALNKEVFVLSRQSGAKADLPFDVQHHRVLLYGGQKGPLRAVLEKWIASLASSDRKS